MFLHMNKLVFVFLFSLIATRSFPQLPDFTFTQISNKHGLSHNQINSLLKDKNGFLWVGTQSGLNRYDGYSFRIFRNNPHDSTSIPNNDIGNIFETPEGLIGIVSYSQLSLYDPVTEKFTQRTAEFYKKYQLPEGLISNIVPDQSGGYWFVHGSQGLIYYNDSTKVIHHLRHQPENTSSVATDLIKAVVHAPQHSTWIVHASGIIEEIKMEKGKPEVVFRTNHLEKINGGQLLDYRIYCDADGDLWLFVMDGTQGLYYVNTKTKQIKNFTQGQSSLNVNIIRSVVQDNRGFIWVGTDHGGINVIDKIDFSFRYVLHQDEDPASLAQNSITMMIKDQQGIIWVGTYKNGISYYHELINRFPLYKHSLLNKNTLPYADVNRFVEDQNGNLWIGTNGGGLLYFDRKKNTYKQYLHNPNQPNSLSSNVIVSLWIDHENKLWIGTYFGGLNSFDGKTFTRYTHNPADPTSIRDQNVWEIFEDSAHRLWVGTLSRGLELFDRKTKTFTHFKSGDLNSVQASYISAIAEDQAGNIWFGSDWGVSILMQQSGRFVQFVTDKKNPRSISSNAVLDIHTDKIGRVWIATQGGLNYYDATTNSFGHFMEEDGLPHNTILTIEEADDGKLWVSTPNGISAVTVTEDQGVMKASFRNYDEADGLQGKQFNENASLKTRAGEMIFGGPNGFNIFIPENLQLNNHLPKVVLTDFQLFSKSIKPDEAIDGNKVLTRSIVQSPNIVLQPGQNVFAIEFAALNFIHPEKNEYQYMLEGFQNDWLKVDNNLRKVSFTNLDPGEYTFKVKASNNDGLWNNEPTTLQITVLPPFWKTKTAFVLYVIFVLLALLVTRKLIQQREQLKFSIQQERQEAMRMHELDMMKIKFFTNVSHEFRTPLTLIITPIEKLMKQATGEDHKRQLQVIYRNGKRLLSLVNQLLDFRKMEVQEIKFNPSEGDILTFVKETVHSFSDLSEKKNIQLHFQSNVETLETIFDQDKLEKILFNLLSNAFKFTQEPGSVSVNVNYCQPAGELEIQVADTGIGIPLDKQEKVFERFFQHDLPTSMVNQGSGIGLSITHEFVRIHGGTIHLKSEEGKGSCFTVVFPVPSIHLQNEVQQATLNDATPDAVIEPVVSVNEKDKPEAKEKPILLLVEDNEDFRFYLKDNLKLMYTILEAKDGQEGLKKALTDFPDLIVSDVMMPVMNGIDLCKKIKSDQRLSHIPVILLTARSSEEQRLEGFETGADDYINKPFNFEILESRIRNLIAQREKLHKVLSRQMGIKASELTITSLDEKFINNAVKCVEEHISDPEFSVEDLSHELGISRAHFYKKILALSGKSPLEFIRTIRLQHAAQLLEKSQLTVAEVAYQVGFNNPKYFARYFKEMYHVLPSAYAAGKRRDR